MRPHRRRYTVIESPLGPLTLVAEDGALCGLYMHRQRHRPPAATLGARNATGFRDAIGQLQAYFAGRRTEFDLPVALVGSRFQRRVWDAVRAIPYGDTASYGEVAAQIGQPGAPRAVGLANGRNPISIIVPCHRVVGAAGGLTGYGGGLERKRQLLDHELEVLERHRAGGALRPLPSPRRAAKHCR